MANTQSNNAENKFADLLLDQVEAVLIQDPCEDSLYDLLKIASPNIERSTISCNHQKHFKKLKFQVLPDRHTGNSERANKIFQSMADFYEQALGSSNRNHARNEKRGKQYPVNFESSEKWTYMHIRRTKCISKEKSLGSQVAYQCINARGSIAHGKKTFYSYSSKDKNDQRSARQVFEACGGCKFLSTPNAIKEELFTRGPVVSSSFQLSDAFLNSVEGRVKYFDGNLENNVHGVLITGWKHTPMGEAWQICPLVQTEHSAEESFDIGFGQYSIDSLCIAPKNTFDDWSWEAGPYFEKDIPEDIETWYSWTGMRFSIDSKQLEVLTETVGGDLITGASSKKRFTLQDSRKKAHSRSCFLKNVKYDKTKLNCWRISVEFVPYEYSFL